MLPMGGTVMGEQQLSAEHLEVIERTCRLLETSGEGPPRLADLAAAADLSPTYLHRLFKKATGVTPRQYADACRVGRLKARLREGATVTTALYEAGYGASSRLYEQAGAQLGMTPGTYQRGGPRERIAYTLTACPLGRLLLAGTERGICALTLADEDAILEAALRNEFPRAELVRQDEPLRAWAEEVCARLGGSPPHAGLPLNVRGTAFQRRVWEELCTIPAGQTRTYGEVAERIGRPTAARAVARACATNPVSVLIPCHRVVRGDGALGGYRWGLARKEALLAQETGAR
jgi:AraC family transcriptional regulator of adaptative response/methylated-DNA-[protein]-cysteine methyltransferase